MGAPQPHTDADRSPEQPATDASATDADGVARHGAARHGAGRHGAAHQGGLSRVAAEELESGGPASPLGAPPLGAGPLGALPVGALPVGRLLAADPAPLRMRRPRRVAEDRAIWLVAAALLALAGAAALLFRAAEVMLWPEGWLGISASDGGLLPTIASALVVLLGLAPAGAALLRFRTSSMMSGSSASGSPASEARAVGEALTRRLMRKHRRAARAHLRRLEGSDGLLIHFRKLLEGLVSAPGLELDRLRLPPDQLDVLRSLGQHPRLRRLFERLEAERYDRIDIRTYRYVLICLQDIVRAAGEHFDMRQAAPDDEADRSS